jgi:hypothetical protein
MAIGRWGDYRPTTCHNLCDQKASLTGGFFCLGISRILIIPEIW